jgi:cell division protease FtsH
MGARIPRGVLLVGAPGNGKTLMAKAIAGEAGVPFFFVSGSEFVEMFVGVGAGRVRDLFKKAKKKEPCVIFIDEIDAVGRQRGAGLGGGNDEREQTLNQILVEMDGFEANTSVIIIGATNRPDVLDPALLRPGRFDRQVTVTAPDKKERELILAVHARNKKLSKDADLGIIARRTAGFSGADLMNVMNEAAILAVRENKTEIDNDAMREAIEKVVLGPSLKTKIITDEQKKLTAYHEAGHALVSTVIPEASDVQKITIIPRGRAGGYTFSDNGDNDPITRKKSEFLADITVLFGGYTVEKEVFGELSTGASNDLAKATETARSMVTKYGMSDLGPVSFDESKGLSFLGRDMVEGKHYSESSAAKIDEEIQKILNGCFERCQKIITQYRKELDLLANTLIEKEVLELEEYNQITKHINPKLSKI